MFSEIRKVEVTSVTWGDDEFEPRTASGFKVFGFFLLCHVRIRWSCSDLRHVLLELGAPEGSSCLWPLWTLGVIAAGRRRHRHLSPLAPWTTTDAPVSRLRRLRPRVGLERPISCQLTGGRPGKRRREQMLEPVRNHGTFEHVRLLNVPMCWH